MSTEGQRRWAKSDRKRMMFYTARYRIEGTLAKMPNVRVSDELNQNVPFLALSDVTVHDLGTGEVLLTKDFLALSKSAVLFASEA